MTADDALDPVDQTWVKRVLCWFGWHGALLNYEQGPLIGGWYEKRTCERCGKNLYWQDEAP